MQGSFTANEVKKRISISSVVKQAVQLKGNGPKFLGLCPFHQEKTPSFHVQDNIGRFKCFGCGAAGDLFEFIMRLRGLSFKEAVAELAGQAGLHSLKIPVRSRSRSHDPALELLQAQKLAHQFFINQLKAPHGNLAREYLIKSRNLSPAMIDQAALGFGGTSAQEFLSYLRDKGISRESAIEAGLIKNHGSTLAPVFMGRIIFPIRRFDGKVIAFGGRNFLEQDQDGPKYVNTHANILYEKRKNFYGLWESKAAILKGLTPVLVEGYFDAMAMWAAGVPSLALCGTALSLEHATLLKRLSSRIIICFDDDSAGHKAVRSALALLAPRNINASSITLDKKDPGDYLADIGALKNRLGFTQDAICFVIDRAVLGAEGDIARRILEIDQLMPIFLSIPRPLIRRQYVAYLAKKMHEDPAILWAEVCRGLKKKPHPIEAQAGDETKTKTEAWILNPTEKLVAQILSHYPQLAPELSLSLRAFLPERFSEHVLSQSMENKALAQALRAEQRQSLVVITLQEAQTILRALDQRVARMTVKAQLKQKRHELQEAEKAKDFSFVLKSLKEQSEILAQGKPAKIIEEQKPIVANPLKPDLRFVPPDYAEEEDWL